MRWSNCGLNWGSETNGNSLADTTKNENSSHKDAKTAKIKCGTTAFGVAFSEKASRPGRLPHHHRSSPQELFNHPPLKIFNDSWEFPWQLSFLEIFIKV